MRQDYNREDEAYRQWFWIERRRDHGLLMPSHERCSSHRSGKTAAADIHFRRISHATRQNQRSGRWISLRSQKVFAARPRTGRNVMLFDRRDKMKKVEIGAVIRKRYVEPGARGRPRR